MDHTEWVQKVMELEERLAKLQQLGHLGPRSLLDVEHAIEELEYVHVGGK